MLGLILAAGMGTRMGDLGIPKCLLKIGDTSLIKYQIDCFHELGINDILVVTGYKSELIEEHLDSTVQYEFLPNHSKVNNLFSIWQAHGKIKGDFVCVYGDLLFHKEILRRCTTSKSNVCLMVEQKVRDETTKVQIEGGKIIQVNKTIPIEKADGNFIGMAKFSIQGKELLFNEISNLVETGNVDAYYTKAIEKMIQKGYPVNFEYTDDYPWIDMDEKHEFEDAKRIFLDIISED